MRKVLIAVALFLGLTFGAAAAAHADSPYKFGPHDTQCQADPNQPNCVGGH